MGFNGDIQSETTRARLGEEPFRDGRRSFKCSHNVMDADGPQEKRRLGEGRRDGGLPCATGPQVHVAAWRASSLTNTEMSNSVLQRKCMCSLFSLQSLQTQNAKDFSNEHSVRSFGYRRSYSLAATSRTSTA